VAAIDERAGRAHANRNGIPVIGTIGILRAATGDGSLSWADAESVFGQMIAAGLRAPAPTLRATIACAFVSPWADETIDERDVLRSFERFARGGARSITLADTVGAADPRVSTLIGIAPPIARYDFGAVERSPKPKFFIQGEFDEICPLKELSLIPI